MFSKYRIILFLGCCVNILMAQQEFTIRGNVYLPNGLSAANAEVNCNKAKVSTNELGHFVFENIKEFRPFCFKNIET